VRVVNGTLTLEARSDGRAVLVLASRAGERIGIERSPDQLRELRRQIDAIAGEPDPQLDPEPPRETPAAAMGEKPRRRGAKARPVASD
jgi:hypothetical protein